MRRDRPEIGEIGIVSVAEISRHSSEWRITRFKQADQGLSDHQATWAPTLCAAFFMLSVQSLPVASP